MGKSGLRWLVVWCDLWVFLGLRCGGLRLSSGLMGLGVSLMWFVWMVVGSVVEGSWALEWHEEKQSGIVG